MKRNKISIFITNNGLLINNKNQITYNKLSSVDNYKVINSCTFLQEITSIFKTKNINNKILTDNIDIMIDTSYTKQDIYLLESIFKELSFNKIDFIYWIKEITIDKNTLLLNISNNAKIYYYNFTLQVNIINNKYTEILETYLKIIIKRYNIKTIKIFGNNKNLLNISEELEKKLNTKTYIYSNSLIYPMNLFT